MALFASSPPIGKNAMEKFFEKSNCRCSAMLISRTARPEERHVRPRSDESSRSRSRESVHFATKRDRVENAADNVRADIADINEFLASLIESRSDSNGIKFYPRFP